MNKARRKATLKLAEEIEALRDKLMDKLYELGEIRDQEQEVYDNLPDSLQESISGTQLEENYDILQEAYEEIETSIDNIDDQLEALKELAEL